MSTAKSSRLKLWDSLQNRKKTFAKNKKINFYKNVALPDCDFSGLISFNHPAKVAYLFVQDIEEAESLLFRGSADQR